MTTQTNAAVSNAVQNTQKVAQSDVAVPVGNLDKKDLQVAYKAIDAAYDIQIRKGGIEDTENTLKTLKDKVGEHVYDVLKRAVEHCKDTPNLVRMYFLALCDQAETYLVNKYIKATREEKAIGKIIPLWPQYKSSLAKGLEMGMSPEDNIPDTDSPAYATAAQFRTEVQKRETEARATGSQAGNGRNTATETTNHLQLVVKGWSPKISAAMQVLMPELNRLTHEEQDTFAPAIMKLASEVKAFADQRTKDAADSASAFNKGETTEPDVDVGTKAALQAVLDAGTAPKAPTEAEAQKAKAAADKEAKKRRGTRAA